MRMSQNKIAKFSHIKIVNYWNKPIKINQRAVKITDYKNKVENNKVKLKLKWDWQVGRDFDEIPLLT